MLKKLRQIFPHLYDYYCHIKMVHKAYAIDKLKQKPFPELIKILERQYQKCIGHSLDWSNLVTYTEKMQWEKMYRRDPIKTQLTDKYAVRAWVAERIGEEYLVPLLGVWDKFEEIDFNKLPQQFVLKTNHGSGTNVIVKDKRQLNLKRTKCIINDWMRIDFGYFTGFELHYSEIPRRIIAEKYLETDRGELQDYKFLCFDGKTHYCWVDMGRYSTHTRNVYDLDWNLQPWNQAFYGVSKEPIPKPRNFEKMIELATVLSAGFSHVRVDLYNVDGRIYFGEMTFTNGSGLDPIVPQEYDRMLGDLWRIDTSKRY